MLKLENIFKMYQDKGQSYQVLNNFNLTLPNNGFVLISGRSGRGKTTLLNLIGGIDKPDNGNIIWNNKNITSMTEEQLTNYRNGEVGFIFQDYGLFENLTVLENITILSKESDELKELLKYLNIYDLRNKKVKELSGGEQQRVAIARAIIKQPNILLCDEITSNIDKENAINVLNLLKKISQKSLVIVVSHDDNLVPQYADVLLNIETMEIETKINHQDIELKEKETSKLTLETIFQFAKSHLIENKKKMIFAILLLGLTMISYFLSNAIQSADISSIHARAMIEEGKESITIIEDRGDFTDEEITRIQNKYGVENVQIGYSYTEEEPPNNVVLQFPWIQSHYSDESAFYNLYAWIPIFYPVRETAFHKEDVIGSIPTEDNEIMIYQYMADLILYHGIYLDDETVLKCQSYEDLMNLESIPLGNMNVKISGIIKQDIDSYENIKKLSTRHANDNKWYTIFLGDIVDPAINIFATDALIDQIKSNYYQKKPFLYFLTNDPSTIKEILKDYPTRDAKFISITAFSTSINNMLDKLEFIAQIFSLILIVIGLLTIIVLVNYIENSIDKHKKEIANLKALGIQRKQMNQIFLLEETMLSTLTIIISLIITIIICAIANYKINQIMLFHFSPLVITFYSALLTLILVYLLCIVITSLLLWKIKKVNPSTLLKK